MTLVFWSKVSVIFLLKIKTLLLTKFANLFGIELLKINLIGSNVSNFESRKSAKLLHPTVPFLEQLLHLLGLPWNNYSTLLFSFLGTITPPYCAFLGTINPPYSAFFGRINPPYWALLGTINPPYCAFFGTINPPYCALLETITRFSQHLP